MTPTEARQIIGRLGWRQDHLAEHAQRTYTGIRNQLRGRSIIDDDLANWLLAFKALLDHPPTAITRAKPLKQDGNMTNSREFDIPAT